jgi:hypothetical protein
VIGWLAFVAMGNADTKLNFRKAVVRLTSKTQPIDARDDSSWDQFWSEDVTNVQDLFTLMPSSEIRGLREKISIKFSNFML